MLKQIDVLRHGEPVGGRMYRGHIDHPLSEKGWAEMWTAVEGRDDWQAIAYSPLLRCAEFATQLSEKLSIPHVADDRLKEIGFGDWEGKRGDEIRAEDADAFKRFYTDPVNNQPDGAERLRSFYLRVSAAWDEQAARDDIERLLIIAHAGVIRAIVTHVMKAPLLSMYRMQIPSAALVSIQFSEERPPMVVI